MIVDARAIAEIDLRTVRALDPDSRGVRSDVELVAITSEAYLEVVDTQPELVGSIRVEVQDFTKH